jgi:hypothetical protein
MPTFSFVIAPAYLAVHLQRKITMLPYLLKQVQDHSFGNMFMPDYYPCSIARLVSCYALFK